MRSPTVLLNLLGDFEPVSIRMAKDQNLSLNPTKISGICGRLMCCLKYESHCYGPSSKKIIAPKVGLEVLTVNGAGKIMSVNQARKTAHISLAEGDSIDLPWEEVVAKGDQPLI